MMTSWQPSPGQVTLIEISAGGYERLSGVVVDSGGGRLVVDLGTSPRAPARQCEVVASFFAADAVYRVKATLGAGHGDDAVIDLRVDDIERVERRASPRARVVVPVVLSDFDDPGSDRGSFPSVLGVSVDVGEGGCRVRMVDPIPAGCDPTVSLHLDNGDAVVALAAVLQSTVVESGCEYRLVFLCIEDDDRHKLGELIAAHLESQEGYRSRR